LPDAIIFGVRKGGTRALLEFVEINTKVAAAGPEIHFFDRDVNYNNGNFTWYREQMPVALDDQLVIEKTPRYFVVRKAIARMKELVEQRKRDCDENLSSSAWTCKPLKLILVVREPVSRLISGYTQIQDKRLKLNKEPGPELEQEVFINGDPAQGLNMRDQKVKTSWYHKFIGGWKRAFGSDILVLDAEVLKKSPWISVEKVEKHLGLPRQVSKDSFVVGPRGFYCIKVDATEEFPTGMRCLNKSKGRYHVEISEKTQTRLRELFKPLNEQFYNDMGINYGWNN